MSDPLTESAAKAHRAERRRGNGVKPPEPPPADPPTLSEGEMERRIAELSKLGALRYALERAAAAKAMKIPAGMLDRLVKGQRPAEEEGGQGRAIAFPPVELWPEAVEGTALLDELVDALNSYVVLTNAQAVAVALWIGFTHLHAAFDVSPRLVAKSAQKRSGKTTLFRVLDRLVAKPRFLSGITASALVRIIELHGPTMLIDEADALMSGDKEMSQALRGMMNAGFDRGGAILTMNVPTRDNGYEPREFSCWAPMAIAGIGELPDTVRDRSIELDMKRKLLNETVKKLRRRDGADLHNLARKIARWADDNIAALRMAEPTMPGALNDRASDAWEPLIAIADLAGGKWPSQARAAALGLLGEDIAAPRDDNVETMLLADIRDAFAAMGVDRFSSESLTTCLTEIDGRPWAEWSRGKPITKYQLSKRLKKYGIVSGTVRLPNGERLSGYHLESFQDAFSRYLPTPSLSTHDS